jgi:hypothetical protein
MLPVPLALVGSWSSRQARLAFELPQQDFREPIRANRAEHSREQLLV